MIFSVLFSVIFLYSLKRQICINSIRYIDIKSFIGVNLSVISAGVGDHAIRLKITVFILHPAAFQKLSGKMIVKFDRSAIYF
jgi:hypothetical protein